MIISKKEEWRKLLDKRVLALQAIFAVTLLATTYTHFRDEAFTDWVQQLPLFLCPWLAIVLQPVLQSRKDQLLTAFALSNTAVILYLFWNAARTILYFHLPMTALFSETFVNQHFSEPLDLHATYLSLYVCLSLVYCVTRGWEQRNAAFFSMAAILLAGLVQLSSKSAWMGLVIILLVGVPLLLFPARRRIAAMGLALSMTVVLASAVLLLQASAFHKRMVTDFKKDMIANKATDPWNQPRMVRWEVAWDLNKARPVLGYGSGSEMTVLKDAYFNEKLYGPYLYALNTHNQFLRCWLTTGLLGLTAYMFMLGLGFAAAWKQKDLVWMTFLVLVTVTSFAENILDVQKGIFYFSFFFAFFFFSNKPSSLTHGQ